MNHILEQLSERGAEDLRSAIEEKEAEILKAIQHLADEREEKEPLKFSLSLKITADLDKSTVTTAVSSTGILAVVSLLLLLSYCHFPEPTAC